jgi:threonine dehydratase
MFDKRYPILGVVVAVSLLAGCGGGGGGGGEATPAKSTSEVIASVSASTLSLDRAATSTVAGADANTDGVRDDVATWIASQNYGSTQVSSVNQLAKAYQAALTVTLSDDNAVRASRLASSNAIECIMQKAPSIEAGYKIVSDLRRVTVNTEARVKAYLDWVAKVNDTVVRAPEGDGCV